MIRSAAERVTGMAHNRKLVLGSVALTKARLPARLHAAALNAVRDRLEQEMIGSDYLENAPFTWVGLIIREGLVDQPKPRLGKIDQKDGELPVAIEIDVNRLIGATQDVIEETYQTATLTSLHYVGQKFGLKVGRLEQLLLPS